MVNLAADRQLIGDALAQLSAEHRAVIRRSYYEARTTAQIADDLRIAEATVKSKLHYALRALRRAVQEMGVTDNAVAVTPRAALDTAAAAFTLAAGVAGPACRRWPPLGQEVCASPRGIPHVWTRHQHAGEFTGLPDA
jgi:Sigma-70, region 4